MKVDKLQELPENVKEKLDRMGMRILDFRVNLFESKLPSTIPDKVTPYRYNIKCGFAFGADDLEITIVQLLVTMWLEGQEEILLTFSTDTIFQVKNLGELQEGDTIELPEPLSGSLINTALGMTRGILYSKNIGSLYQGEIMPLFNLPELLPKGKLQLVKTNPSPSNES